MQLDWCTILPVLRLEKGDKVRVHKDPCHRVVSIIVFDPLVSASVVVHLKAGPQLNCSFRGGKFYQDDVRDGAGVVGLQRQVKVIPQDIETLLECFLWSIFAIYTHNRSFS